MFFLFIASQKKRKQNKRCKSIGNTPLRVRLHIQKTTDKRTSHSVLRKGSMSVEAAIVLPLFFRALAAFLLLCKLFYFYYETETALIETARQIARQEYFTSQENREGNASLLTRTLFMKNRKQGDEAAGLSADYYDFSGTTYLAESKELCICLKYRVKIPLFLLGNWSIRMSHSIVQKAWNGYAPVSQKSEGTENTVYLARDGEVYHTDGTCYHLSVNIDVVDDTALYYDGKTSKRPCEHCVGKNGRQEILYVTEDGECYHESLSCSGLIRRISISTREQAVLEEGRSLCSDCGKRENE